MITWGDLDEEAGDRLTTTNLTAVSKKNGFFSQGSMHKEIFKQCTPANRKCFSSTTSGCHKNVSAGQFYQAEVPQLVKTSDKEWVRLQTFMLDALAPLTSLLESDAKGETISHNQALEATKAATQPRP